MRITVLFDLDDTLISNDMDAFLKVYLKELSQFIPNIAPQEFITDLLTATGKMAAGYWQHSGHHAEIGPITLLSLVHTIAKHDQEHLKQANRLFKAINQPAV